MSYNYLEIVTILFSRFIFHMFFNTRFFRISGVTVVTKKRVPHWFYRPSFTQEACLFDLLFLERSAEHLCFHHQTLLKEIENLESIRSLLIEKFPILDFPLGSNSSNHRNRGKLAAWILSNTILIWKYSAEFGSLKSFLGEEKQALKISFHFHLDIVPARIFPRIPTIV